CLPRPPVKSITYDPTQDHPRPHLASKKQNFAHLLPTSTATAVNGAHCSPVTRAARAEPPSDIPRCPDCGTPLKQIDSRPGKEAWVGPVALEAKRRGLLGKPGRKHKECWVWTRQRR